MNLAGMQLHEIRKLEGKLQVKSNEIRKIGIKLKHARSQIKKTLIYRD
jgi:hypothetical protein